MAKYTFYLMDGTPLVDVLPNESNGPGALSSPVRPLQIIQPNVVMLDGDVSERFIAGFNFDIISLDSTNPSPYAGTYEVASIAVENNISYITTTTDIVPPANQTPSYAIVPPVDVISHPAPDVDLYDLVWTIDGNHISEFGVGGRFLVKTPGGVVLAYFATDVVYDATADVTRLTANVKSTTLPIPEQSGDILIPISGQDGIAVQYSLPAASSLRLIGSNVVMYNSSMTWGNAIQQSLLDILQQFAGPTAPDNPVIGQPWFDTSDNTRKNWTGSDWV